MSHSLRNPPLVKFDLKTQKLFMVVYSPLWLDRPVHSVAGRAWKANYKAVPFSGQTIWGHLDARLVADWPPALTHMHTHSQWCIHIQTQFFSSGWLFGISAAEKNKSWYSDPFHPASISLCFSLWFEYRSLNWMSGTWPAHSHFSSPLPSLSLPLYFSFNPLSPSFPCLTVPLALSLSSYEIQDVSFFFHPQF